MQNKHKVLVIPWDDHKRFCLHLKGSVFTLGKIILPNKPHSIPRENGRVQSSVNEDHVMVYKGTCFQFFREEIPRIRQNMCIFIIYNQSLVALHSKKRPYKSMEE